MQATAFCLKLHLFVEKLHELKFTMTYFKRLYYFDSISISLRFPLLMAILLFYIYTNSYAQLIGPPREDFILNANKSCFTSQRSNSTNKIATDKNLADYCTCYSKYLADTITNKLLEDIEKSTRPLSDLTWAIPLAAQYCKKQILRKDP